MILVVGVPPHTQSPSVIGLQSKVIRMQDGAQGDPTCQNRTSTPSGQIAILIDSQGFPNGSVSNWQPVCDSYYCGLQADGCCPCCEWTSPGPWCEACPDACFVPSAPPRPPARPPPASPVVDPPKYKRWACDCFGYDIGSSYDGSVQNIFTDVTPVYCADLCDNMPCAGFSYNFVTSTCALKYSHEYVKNTCDQTCPMGNDNDFIFFERLIFKYTDNQTLVVNEDTQYACPARTYRRALALSHYRCVLVITSHIEPSPAGQPREARARTTKTARTTLASKASVRQVCSPFCQSLSRWCPQAVLTTTPRAASAGNLKDKCLDNVDCQSYNCPHMHTCEWPL